MASVMLDYTQPLFSTVVLGHKGIRMWTICLQLFYDQQLNQQALLTSLMHHLPHS